MKEGFEEWASSEVFLGIAQQFNPDKEPGLGWRWERRFLSPEWGWDTSFNWTHVIEGAGTGSPLRSLPIQTIPKFHEIEILFIPESISVLDPQQEKAATESGSP